MPSSVICINVQNAKFLDAEAERLHSEAFSTMIDIAEKTFNIPVRKKLARNSRSATQQVRIMLTIIAILNALKTGRLVVLKGLKYVGFEVWCLVNTWFKQLAGLCLSAFSICLFFAEESKYLMKTCVGISA